MVVNSPPILGRGRLRWEKWRAWVQTAGSRGAQDKIIRKKIQLWAVWKNIKLFKKKDLLPRKGFAWKTEICADSDGDSHGQACGAPRAEWSDGSPLGVRPSRGHEEPEQVCGGQCTQPTMPRCHASRQLTERVPGRAVWSALALNLDNAGQG